MRPAAPLPHSSFALGVGQFAACIPRGGLATFPSALRSLQLSGASEVVLSARGVIHIRIVASAWADRVMPRVPFLDFGP